MILPPEPDLHRFEEREPSAAFTGAAAAGATASFRDRDRARALERATPAMPTHVGRASLRPYKQPPQPQPLPLPLQESLSGSGVTASASGGDPLPQLGSGAAVDPSALYQGVYSMCIYVYVWA